MAKTSRYTLGQKIDDLFIEIAESILLGSYLSKEQKLPLLQKAITKLDLLKFFLQVAWETRTMDERHYAALSEPLHEIGRMLGGWKKGIENKTPA